MRSLHLDTEIEAKFLNVDHKRLRAVLRAQGAELLLAERLMRRRIFDHPTRKQNDWFRVRDEGEKVTLSYKQLIDRSLHGTKEVSVIVNDFERTCQILLRTGLVEKAYQETKRELWRLRACEVALDTWPWIPPFVELEADSEEELKKVVALLGLRWDEALHGSVETAYQRYYEVTEKEVDSWPRITFVEIPERLEKKRKNIT